MSASDLSKHLECRFLTQLDWAYAEDRLEKNYHKDLSLEAFQIRGFQHEKAYLEHLRKESLTIMEIGEHASQAKTIQSMQEGYDIITQATISNQDWVGRVDILKKVKLPSRLGDWSYQVFDTKLSQETKAATIIQLCLYSDLLSDLQGIDPELMGVIPPGFLTTEYYFNEYSAYFRMLRDSLMKTILDPPLDLNQPKDNYPKPVAQCDFCDWNTFCKEKRRRDDDLSIIAGITKLQKEELHRQPIKTITSFVEWEMPTKWRPSKGLKESYVKTKDQARVQHKSQQEKKAYYELLPRNKEHGLNDLPPPSIGDIFFDIEGDVFVGSQGLEYLLGFSCLNEKKELIYTSLWSKNADDEKKAFEEFIRFVVNHLNEYPDLHIYHYAPYEPGAIKRLANKHATCENEVDYFLKNQIFIDLMRIVKRSMIVGVERYSIKELEILYGFYRDVPLRKASNALHHLEFMYEIGQAEALQKRIADVVEGYNQDDCTSTRGLRDWLEGVRNDLIKKGETIERPVFQAVDDNIEQLSEKQKQIKNLQEKLMSGIPQVKKKRSFREEMTWVLSQLLEFHERERKAMWWQFFRLADLTKEDLLYEKAGIHNLVFTGETGGTVKKPICRYSFPNQEVDIKTGDEAKLVGGDHYGIFESVNLLEGFVEIKKKAEIPHVASVFAFEKIPAGDHLESIRRLSEWVAERGIDSLGKFRCARDLLLKKRPRMCSGVSSEKLQREDESNVEATIRITRELNTGVLAIQGPPGSGKTYLASQVIASLVKQGKKVGVTALSHKVILNLLQKTIAVCDEKGLEIHCIHRVSGKPLKNDSKVQMTNKKYDHIVEEMEAGEINVIGGTSWMWSKEIFFESVDYLFIEEAGQFSLADALAVAQAGKNLILLGDHQQLERPIRGVHPEDTDTSALQHFMGKNAVTISEEKGIFLQETWRMHPDICCFISEQFYNGKLKSREECSKQTLVGSAYAGTGLHYIPVKHQGRQSYSPEEVEVVSEVYQGILLHASWIDRNQKKSKITPDDLLIITPYNAQVRRLQEVLPQARIGTVDKFQGQEATVVIYSLTSSDVEEVPHGMIFLYSQNRLNVAISRAKCISIIIGNPQLFHPSCRDPFQMKLANSFCRYKEKAEENNK